MTLGLPAVCVLPLCPQHYEPINATTTTTTTTTIIVSDTPTYRIPTQPPKSPSLSFAHSLAHPPRSPPTPAPTPTLTPAPAPTPTPTRRSCTSCTVVLVYPRNFLHPQILQIHLPLGRLQYPAPHTQTQTQTQTQTPTQIPARSIPLTRPIQSNPMQSNPIDPARSTCTIAKGMTR
ncbi:hypothetical protein DENSPDRAFT_227162 [Dentipellis sp. KUC8613]|nr:hypothetical protein DENSPDRAFT_227162 [Dentipellis sp. KUC8613]